MELGAKRERALMEPTPNGCACLRNGERYLTSGYQTAAEAATITKTLTSEPTLTRAKANHSIADHQRTATAAGQQLMEVGGNVEADDELLHVLVTRPEIAGKPRDNIVFEGDMDLRTTFETSYEALAKMRLDCWKKYQESSSLGAAPSRPEETPAASSGQRTLEAQACHRNRCQTTKAEEDVSVPAKRRRSPLPPPMTANGVRGVQQPASGGSRSTAALALDRRPQRKPTQHSGAAESTAVATQTPEPESSQLHNISSRDQNNLYTPKSSQPTSRDIDPDLTPIIVYDANMNRLEKVGLRKRSKYRPSTSLRAGSRGLFGDQQPATTEAEAEERPRKGPSGAPPLSGHHQQAAAAAPQENSSRGRGYAGVLAGGRRSPPLGDNDSGNLARRRQVLSPEFDSSGALNNDTLSARNLKDSRQANYLTYSNGNLPVDSKRKLRDNVNMTDHIREQNICAESRRQAGPTVARRMSGGRNGDGGGHGNDDDDVSLWTQDKFHNVGGSGGHEEQNNNNEPRELLQRDRHDDNADADINKLQLERDIRLAREEEAAAVEELQKVTLSSAASSLDNARQPETAAEVGAVGTPGRSSSSRNTADGHSKTYLDSYQTRLQKTCQNQSFYLFENDYPEQARVSFHAPTDSRRSAGGGAAGARKSPNPTPSGSHNLFRESPDFILTTGKFLEQEKRGLRAASDAAAAAETAALKLEEGGNSINAAAASSGRVRHQVDEEDVRDGDGQQCRVLRLNQDYQFVGSRSGHNYFVEKERGETHIVAS